MSEKGFIPFNGKTSSFTRVVEALIVAGIVGGLSIWGNSRVVDVKLEAICGSVTKLETVANSLSSSVSALMLKDATQEIRIDSLERQHGWNASHKKAVINEGK